MSFLATLAYELAPDTTPEARKWLRAELCGRRWQDRYEGQRMPDGCLWIRRSKTADETVDDLLGHCERELAQAAAAVRSGGRPLEVRRAWVQVSGAGTWGLLALPTSSE